MGPTMYPVLMFVCIGIVFCDEKTVTVTPVTSVTPPSSNSTSRVLIENKVQNLTVQYNSNHGQNNTYVFSPKPSNQTTDKPLIITTSKEMRVIKTPSLNDSVTTANTHSKSNATQRQANEIKHQVRASVKKPHSTHFLPTMNPETSPKFANLTKILATKSQTYLAKNQTVSKHPAQNQHPVQRHVQNYSKTQLHSNPKLPIRNNSQYYHSVGHASEIEMHKVEVKEMRYVEAPKDNKKFRYFMAANENSSRPGTSSQTFEIRFPSKTGQKIPETKQMDKYKVRSTPYYDNQNYQNTGKVNGDSTGAPLQYMTPPPPVYTMRTRIHDVNNISITTTATPIKFDGTNQISADVHFRAGPRDFSCLRCFGHSAPQKNYKYPTYANKHDPILGGNRAVNFFGPERDNLLGGSKHHYVVAKPDPNATLTGQEGQAAKKPDLTNQVKGYLPPKRHEASAATGKHNTTETHPRNQSSKPQDASTKLKTPYALMNGLGSYTSPSIRRPGEFQFPEKPGTQTPAQKENWSTQFHSLAANQMNKPMEETNLLRSPLIRNPLITDSFSGHNFASSNLEFSVSRPSGESPSSPFKLDPSSGLYDLDEELHASATAMHKHHPDVQVETKEIHIPIPHVVETRVPYPIHIKVDRPVAVHIDKPYPVHVEKTVPVPVKVNVPQPYPVEKEVPYPVKIPIEVPRPVEVPKPVPYLVENPVPVQVFKHVKVPVKVPVDVPVPYKVEVQVQKRVPYFVEKKVPFEVPVPVEKPYLVEVKKPFEVPQEKPHPVTVEKKIPVPVQVVEFVKVHVPVQVPHEHSYQHNFQHIQHRFGEASDQKEQTPEQGTRLVTITVDRNGTKPHPSGQSQSSASHQAKMEVVLPDTISVEFPTGYGHQPAASGSQPSAIGAQT